MTEDKKKKKVGQAETVNDSDVTEAAVDAAKQSADIVSEKRSSEPVVVAKAGKRSAKAIAAKEENAAKEARKAETESIEEKPKSKQPVKPPRSKLERRGKKYRKAAEQIHKNKYYTLKEAASLAIKISTSKFDATVEFHVRLGVDPRQADQNIRDNIVLPAGTGKTVRVAVFAEEDDVKAAKKAGADIAGSDDFLAQLDKGKIDFDVLVATPQVMARLSKYARVLGPKGLMPNPKSGTVTSDVAKAVEQSKAGRVEYRVDSTGIVHIGAGKVSFGEEKLMQNLEAIVASIKQNKPSSIKGTYVRTVTLTTTMGPGIKISTSEIS